MHHETVQKGTNCIWNSVGSVEFECVLLVFYTDEAVIPAIELHAYWFTFTIFCESTQVSSVK